MAILEIGVTAALAAAAANWLILRRAPGARGPAGPAEDQEAPGADRRRRPAHRRAGVPPDRSPIPGPPALVDETDDAGGHRIYLNPWAETGRPRYRPPSSCTSSLSGTYMPYGTTQPCEPTETRYWPFCSTLISPPTELVNWVWHACWAATVFAPLMQV